jgi:hypothetical protein
MLYDSNGFKSYIYVLFYKTCPCATYIYILYWPYAKIRCISNFRAVSEVSGTAEVVLTGHVQLMDQTYPASQTCPAPGPDIFWSRVLANIYKGDEDPFES